jgi:hypothetical protein
VVVIGVDELAVVADAGLESGGATTGGVVTGGFVPVGVTGRGLVALEADDVVAVRVRV